ncbi:hypothetical protein COO91_08425 [Nostoc flagelliforme CCNUN1]|uniref:Uncharacterized protein n=1 Tax=Nostoc flagelliforme CCNUN1 TaxID=2038116 RepID=A0A2K8T3K9_9NOSO|nr:hypothetical protein COO91_08425 [Nostoc flagelliforme CCNUN1]
MLSVVPHLHALLHTRQTAAAHQRLHPDFSQDFRKEGSKTARMYVAKEF